MSLWYLAIPGGACVVFAHKSDALITVIEASNGCGSNLMQVSTESGITQ